MTTDCTRCKGTKRVRVEGGCSECYPLGGCICLVPCPDCGEPDFEELKAQGRELGKATRKRIRRVERRLGPKGYAE